jgi:hypothetical protein
MPLAGGRSGCVKRRHSQPTIDPDPPLPSSGRLPAVEAQKSTEPLPAIDRPGPRVIGWRLEEPPIEALVVALGVVVGDVFSDGRAEMVLAQQHELAETLALDGSHQRSAQAFQVGLLVVVRLES